MKKNACCSPACVDSVAAMTRSQGSWRFQLCIICYQVSLNLPGDCGSKMTTLCFSMNIKPQETEERKNKCRLTQLWLKEGWWTNLTCLIACKGVAGNNTAAQHSITDSLPITHSPSLWLHVRAEHEDRKMSPCPCFSLLNIDTDNVAHTHTHIMIMVTCDLL